MGNTAILSGACDIGDPPAGVGPGHKGETPKTPLLAWPKVANAAVRYRRARPAGPETTTDAT
ncbi:MAG: hypothetical protein HLUCCA08_03780 [Rhodobacteraceae bacterium HLUCCA08]|nr:MAG: hypothetical protein HLUCCA08_03780 [Rhodobacteraceae bacterium HLUCCA08]